MAATQERTSTRVLKMGIIGIGVGATEVMPAFERMSEVELAAGADPIDETLERFHDRFAQTKLYNNAKDLVNDPNVEAVWISSPNRFHAEHTILAANAGKHVVVEKPMAITLEEADAMINACDKNGVKLIAGHTTSYSLPMRAIRRLILSGQYGRLTAMNMWSYSDWMLRPRSSDELDVNQGGGIPYRQGPHQVDTVRFIGGGKVRSVRAQFGAWSEIRPIPGYYAAFLEFEDGTPTIVVHNGYGYFLGAELVPWGESVQQYNVEERVAIRKALRAGTRKETEDKQDMRIGGPRERRGFGAPGERRGWTPGDPGMLILSCERGDIRQSRFGLNIYDDEGVTDRQLKPAAETAGRRAELVELYEDIVDGKPSFHDGKWGIGTLEVCLAILQSGRERKEVMMSHQKAVPEDFDKDLVF